MKSCCTVILPDNINGEAPKDLFWPFVKKQAEPYNTELEIEPYKVFESPECTYHYAGLKGFGEDLEAFGNYLKNRKLNPGDTVEGIENGLFYYYSTYNKDGFWDYYLLADDFQHPRPIKELKKIETYSILTMDGVWHSMMDYADRPILDFENNFLRHPDNEMAYRQWTQFCSKIYKENKQRFYVVLNVHS